MNGYQTVSEVESRRTAGRDVREPERVKFRYYRHWTPKKPRNGVEAFDAISHLGSVWLLTDCLRADGHGC